MFISMAGKSIFCVFITTVFSSIVYSSFAQIGIGINPPDSSAMLHVQDTAKGMLIPRMTAAQKNAIQHPAEGLMVYQTDGNKGFWYYTGTQWTGFDKGYKSILYLTGDITDSEAAEKIALEAGPTTQEIQITDCSLLTTVDLSGVTTISKINIVGNPVLQTVNFANLKNVDLTINISQCPALTTLNFPLLQRTAAVTIGGIGVVSLAMPTLQKLTNFVYTGGSTQSISLAALKTVTGYIQLSGTTLSNLALPALETVGSYLWFNKTGIVNLTLPALQKTPAVYLEFNANMQSASFPVLTGAVSPAVFNLSVISNQNIASVVMPSLVSADRITIRGNKQCSSLNFSSLNTVNALRIKSDSALASISFPSLVSVTKALEIMDDSVNTSMGSQLFSFPLLASADSIAISRIKSTSISLPALTTVGNSDYAFNILTTLNLTNVSLPSLTSVGGGFSVSANSALTTLSIPSLTTVGGKFWVSSNKALTSFTATSLVSAQGIELLSDSLLTSVAFPALTTVTGTGPTPGTQYLYIYNNHYLTDISIPALSTLNVSVILTWNHLSSAAINAILNKLVSTSISNKIINTQQQSPLAPPTGQGLTDKATLQARGNNVYTD